MASLGSSGVATTTCFMCMCALAVWINNITQSQSVSNRLLHGPHIYHAWGLYLVFVNATLEGAAFTSQIQISRMHYNCFVYIVREWIKGAFSVCRPCTKEKDFMLMTLPCVAGMLPASTEWCCSLEGLGFWAVKPKQAYHADLRNVPYVRTLCNVPLTLLTSCVLA